MSDETAHYFYSNMNSRTQQMMTMNPTVRSTNPNSLPMRTPMTNQQHSYLLHSSRQTVSFVFLGKIFQINENIKIHQFPSHEMTSNDYGSSNTGTYEYQQQLTGQMIDGESHFEVTYYVYI